MAIAQSAKSRPKAAAHRRKRRSTREIVDRMIEAAVVEFGETGYSGATTASIARRAEVAEALIFTHFGSKANLFRKAVFKPLDDHFSRFIESHPHADGAVSETGRESREFVSELVRFVGAHSGLFRSLVLNAAAKGEEGATGLRGLQDYLEKMSAREEARLASPPKVAPRLIARISFAAILGCLVFDDWLFPEGIAPDSEIHAALCDFIMEGLQVNPGMHQYPSTRADFSAQ